ncbi:N-acetylmuramoyl-L-alanine amidase [Streptomyces sp. NPDC051577]|uniref:peptidoglycan recognition protein family protein n=1 Tax=Streptomyces sp. NPDC051577 TaxID=3155166 RepID=UPI003439255D
MTADQLVAALAAEGVRYVEYRSWRTHNRNHKGPWGPVHGVYIHHTAGVSKTMADICYDGYSELPGPVCHGMLAKTARVYLVGNGRANHAGGIAQNAYDAAVNEATIHPRPDADEPIDGNVHFYGLEIENEGDGNDPFPADQYDQAVRWAAAHCRFHGWSADSVIGHKEATRRKVDPTFSMPLFRAAVAERLRHPASWSPTANPPTSEEGDVSLTPQQAEQLNFLATYGGWAYKGTGKVDAWGLLNTLTTQVAALQGAINALAKAVADGDDDADALIAAVKQAIADATVHVAVTVDDNTSGA